MIIISEITGGQYKTVEECLEAEREFAFKKEAEEKARKEKAEAELKRKKEIDEAYEKAMKACEDYLKLVGVKVNFKNKDGSRKLFATIEANDFLDGVDQILDSIINL